MFPPTEHTIKIYPHRTNAITENTIENVKSLSFLNYTAIKKTENEQEKKYVARPQILSIFPETLSREIQKRITFVIARRKRKRAEERRVRAVGKLRGRRLKTLG